MVNPGIPPGLVNLIYAALVGLLFVGVLPMWASGLPVIYIVLFICVIVGLFFSLGYFLSQLSELKGQEQQQQQRRETREVQEKKEGKDQEESKKKKKTKSH